MFLSPRGQGYRISQKKLVARNGVILSEAKDLLRR
jgi:hypothetical protein